LGPGSIIALELAAWTVLDGRSCVIVAAPAIRNATLHMPDWNERLFRAHRRAVRNCHPIGSPQLDSDD